MALPPCKSGMDSDLHFAQGSLTAKTTFDFFLQPSGTGVNDFVQRNKTEDSDSIKKISGTSQA